jgi:hypothetical protein
MNRHAIATIGIDDEGYAVWSPNSRFVELGFQETRLGFKPENQDSFRMAIADGCFRGFLPEHAYQQAVDLYSAARTAKRRQKATVANGSSTTLPGGE